MQLEDRIRQLEVECLRLQKWIAEQFVKSVSDALIDASPEERLHVQSIIKEIGDEERGLKRTSSDSHQKRA